MENSEARKRKEEGVKELTVSQALETIEQALIGAASMLRQIIATAESNRD
jgi:hypothetical protein